MTTAIYHNNVLAADSRITQPNNERDGEEPRCSHCGEQSRMVRDNYEKIEVYNGTARFRGEVILAAAGSGMANQVKMHLKALREIEDYEKTWNDTKVFRTHQETRSQSDLIVVTTDHVYMINLGKSREKLNVKVHGRDETLSIGSGSGAALCAAKVYGADAVLAIQHAEIVDEWTGGPVASVALNVEPLAIVKTDPLKKE